MTSADKNSPFLVRVTIERIDQLRRFEHDNDLEHHCLSLEALDSLYEVAAKGRTYLGPASRATAPTPDFPRINTRVVLLLQDQGEPFPHWLVA